MNYKLKNVLLVFCVLLSLFIIFFTLNYAKNNLDNKNITISDDFSENEMKRGEIGDIDESNIPSDLGEGKMKGEINEDNLPDDIDNNIEGELKTPDKTNEMADGGFAGAGETLSISTASANVELTLTYILFIGIWCLIITLCVTYLLMSKFGKVKVFSDSNKILIYVLLNIILAVVLTMLVTIWANNYYLNSSSEVAQSTVEYSSTDDLHIDMTAWNYDETNNVYWQIGIVYCSLPETVEYESMGIYVPGDYFDGVENSDGTYTCTVNTENEIGGYTALTAPIVMPVNTAGYSAQAAPTSYSYSGLGEYLDAGFIYVYAGCRGRNNGDDYSGGAPWGVTDLKAAIRYIRYNDESLPGDTDSIFVFGHSGGGAQSSVVGVTGDSSLYTPYLESIGAIIQDDGGNEISDAVAGVMAWCPITSLDYADEAYEWNMGQYSTTGTRSDNSWTSALSDDLSEAYANYINALMLVDDAGNILTLTNNGDGIYTTGTYYEYILDVIEGSLNNYLVDNYSDVSQMQSYIDELNSDEEWVTFDSTTLTVTISSIEDFVNNCKSASKDVGAFDDLNCSQAENYVFGNDESDALHFDQVMADLLNKNADAYSTYSDYDSTYATDYLEDLENVDKLGNDTYYRQNMYNPMYYLCDYYEGYKTSQVAKYWRIRTGITQSDTALTVETNLSLALQNYETVESVDFETVWAQGHTTAERTGDSTTNFIEWVNECVK